MNEGSRMQPKITQPDVKKNGKIAKILGLVLLILVLITATAFCVYTWQQNELTAQKKNYESQLAAVKAGNIEQPATNDRPTHEQAPPKVVTETTCNADELALSLAAGDGGGAGTLNQMIVLTNTSKRTCILGGFPGVSLVNDNGNQIGTPAERIENYVEKKLTLSPGGQAKATISFHDPSNYDSGTCKTGATKLRVYPPNDTGYLSVASTMITTWCPGFEVSPVQ